jgi:SWI/SNF-related matrix-associated actin-dependent regulator of chromatin subfamily A member 5
VTCVSFYVCSDWNPQVDLQAQDRAHRIGQQKPVQVFRFITEGSIEEKVVERAMIKLKLDAVVVQQGRLADRNKALSKEEMLEMVQFGADAIFKTQNKTGADADEVTEADIDELLRIGAAKTKNMAETVAKKVGPGVGGGLLDFKINSSSSQTFEGVDFKDKAERERLKQLRLAIANGMSDAVGARAVKKTFLTYNEEEVFKALAATQSSGSSNREPTS